MDDRNKKLETLYHKCIENFWHLVGHKVDLPTKNSYKCITLGRYDLFLYKVNNQIKAFLNVCPHRGAKLFNEINGQSALKCPYHGWTFTPSKTYVPRIDTFKKDPNPENAKLTEWEVEIKGGFIFIAKEPSFSLSKQLGDEVVNIISLVGNSIEKFESVQNLFYNSNWLITIENALEPYHLNNIHPKSLNELKLNDGFNKIWEWSSLWNAESNNKRLKNLSTCLKGTIDSKISIKGYWSLYLFPFVQISSTEGLSFSIQIFDPCTSSLSEKTNFHTYIYSPKLKVKSRDRGSFPAYYEAAKKLNFQVFDEDREICSRVPLSSWSFSSLNYSSELEIKINHFRKCCREALNL